VTGLVVMNTALITGDVARACAVATIRRVADAR
jgi:hypothetical protein